MDTGTKIKLFFLKIKALLKLTVFIFFELNKIKKAKVIFFFPYYHTGGAEKIHLSIVKAVGDIDNYIFFTDKSYSDNFKTQFSDFARNYDVYEFLNRNAIVKKIFISALAKKINSAERLVSVFGCNSAFYYEFLPYLRVDIIKNDLVHAFSKPDYGIEMVSLPYVKMLDNRVVINAKTKQDFIELYKEHGLSDFKDRIQVISNGLSIEKRSAIEKDSADFYVGFFGRWAKEKRPELYLKIADKVRAMHPEISFVMAGPNLESNSDSIANVGVLNLGEIQDDTVLNQWYGKLDVILITSYREGFPMVIMEGMSFGVIPISTNIGSVSEHVLDDKNGFIVENNLTEIEIINQFVEKISYLYLNQDKKKELSDNAKSYAIKEFGIDNFNSKYKTLLLKNNSK